MREANGVTINLLAKIFLNSIRRYVRLVTLREIIMKTKEKNHSLSNAFEGNARNFICDIPSNFGNRKLYALFTNCHTTLKI